MMDRWEYKVLSPGGMLTGIKPEDLEGQLNELGQDGWEVAGISAMENTAKVLVVLKRHIGGEAAKSHGSSWGKW
jgi:hypothetical protein